MAKFISTIWFRESISIKKVVNGLAQAASRIQAEVSLIQSNERRDNNESVWAELMSGFQRDEYSGEVKWQIHGSEGVIKGSIIWPIVNPGDLPSTVEFGFNFDSVQKNKLKTYTFRCPYLLLDFLMPICSGVKFYAMAVEPQKIPDDLAERRYEQFERLYGKCSLTSVDWIFGLRSTDPQSRQLSQHTELFEIKKQMSGLTLYCVKNEPLNYESEKDIKLLNDIESVIGVSDN